MIPALRPLATIAVVGFLLLGVSPVAMAAGTETSCRGDQCDDGRWAAARSDSFWGMSPGHNCTNYVAWRLESEGIARPSVSLGNAATWAERSATAGLTVDQTPAVGAVAQWGGFVGGHGYAGHVAYIEAVGDDGTVLISEDYWHGGNQLGPLTYRTIDASSIANVIHFEGDGDAFDAGALGSAGWQQSTRRYPATPDLIAATSAGSGAPLVVATAGGRLVELDGGGAATITDTGIASAATSLAAVSRGSMAYVMTVEDGTLAMSVRNDGVWTAMPTGLDGIVGDISVVDEGTLTPTVLLAQSEGLYVVFLDTEGWQVYTTGARVSGPIRAVLADGELSVFSIADGQVVRTWWNGATWNQEGSGILADSVAAAVAVESGIDVTLVREGRLVELTRSQAGWRATDLGLRAGTAITAIGGGVTPAIFQVG